MVGTTKLLNVQDEQLLRQAAGPLTQHTVDDLRRHGLRCAGRHWARFTSAAVGRAASLSPGVDAFHEMPNVQPSRTQVGAPCSFLFLVVRPGAPSSVLAHSSDARSP